jgi:ABC-type bacteriocin/lantibiotic exporter with double-glycine peptidase domain
MPVSDTRVKLCTEVFAGIRVIKYFNWEERFGDLIKKQRSKEVVETRKELKLFAFNIFIMIVFPVVGMAATFLAYSFSGNQISASNAFALLAFFNIMRFPLNQLGTAIISAQQAKVAIHRLSKMLRLISTYKPPTATAPSSSASEGEKQSVISCLSASFAWNGNELKLGSKDKDNDTSYIESAQLRNVTFDVKQGELLFVCGTVGGGKSTLMNGLLGEIDLLRGESHVRGKIAYVPQEAWIQNASIRDNILFGSDFHEDHYNSIIDAVVLAPDINRFDDRDFTIIGEKGVTLSGGQKQRISLARAGYSVLCGKSDIVLLDDPLSALDAETGGKVFDNLLGPAGIMKATTRVLVTHAIQYIPQGDCLLVISNGKSIYFGKAGGLEEIIAGFVASGSLEDAESLRSLLAAGEPKHEDGNSSQISSQETTAKMQTPVSVKASGISISKSVVGVSKLMTKEEAAAGVVSFEVVKAYFDAAGGVCFILALCISLSLERVAYAGSDFWLAVWTSADAGGGAGLPSFLPTGRDTGPFYVGIYIGISVLACFFAYFRTWLFAEGGAKASIVLFSRLLDALLRSPVTFFEVLFLFSPSFSPPFSRY